MRAHRLWPGVMALVLVLVGLVALAWWFPARWAWQWARADYAGVHVGGVGGTVWDGHMAGVVVAGQRLGAVHWKLGRAAVLGHVHGSIDLHGAGVSASGRFQRGAHDVLVIREVHFTVSMSRLRSLWPAGTQLEGQLQGVITKASLVSGWPSRLDARLNWRDAAVVTQDRRLAFGEWTSRWHSAGGTVVTAQLRDANNGPVQLRGTFTVTPLGWRLAAMLTPRDGNDDALRRWLQRLGTPMPDGGIRIDRQGGLMMGATR